MLGLSLLAPTLLVHEVLSCYRITEPQSWREPQRSSSLSPLPWARLLTTTLDITSGFPGLHPDWPWTPPRINSYLGNPPVIIPTCFGAWALRTHGAFRVIWPAWKWLQNVAPGSSLTWFSLPKESNTRALEPWSSVSKDFSLFSLPLNPHKYLVPRLKWLLSLLLAQFVMEMLSGCSGEVNFLYVSIVSQKENNIYCQCLNKQFWGDCFLYDAFSKESFPVLCSPWYCVNKERLGLSANPIVLAVVSLGPHGHETILLGSAPCLMKLDILVGVFSRIKFEAR